MNNTTFDPDIEELDAMILTILRSRGVAMSEYDIADSVRQDWSPTYKSLMRLVATGAVEIMRHPYRFRATYAPASV